MKEGHRATECDPRTLADRYNVISRLSACVQKCTEVYRRARPNPKRLYFSCGTSQLESHCDSDDDHAETTATTTATACHALQIVWPFERHICDAVRTNYVSCAALHTTSTNTHTNVLIAKLSPRNVVAIVALARAPELLC